MGMMKEIFNKYTEEWDTHDCKVGPDDSCSICDQYSSLEDYASARFTEEYGKESSVKSWDELNEDEKCLNTDDVCEDCGKIHCQAEKMECTPCGYVHCADMTGCSGMLAQDELDEEDDDFDDDDDEDDYEDDEDEEEEEDLPLEPKSWDDIKASTMDDVINGYQKDPILDPLAQALQSLTGQFMSDPPSWKDIDEDTKKIDINEFDFLIREPNALDNLKSANAARDPRQGQGCIKCGSVLQVLGSSPPFCGKCELELEKQQKTR